MVETTPILVSIVRLLCPTHVRLVHLSQILILSLFVISVPALIHSAFVDAGANFVDNCQQLAIHFLLAKHLQKDASLMSSSLVSERWRIANEQNSRSARSTVRAIHAMLPEEMADRTDDELLEYYKVDDTLSDFV
jgi:hypothetical protein